MLISTHLTKIFATLSILKKDHLHQHANQPIEFKLLFFFRLMDPYFCYSETYFSRSRTVALLALPQIQPWL